MSIRSKVTACFAVIISLFVGLAAYNYIRFNRANQQLILVNEFFLPFSRSVVQLQGSIYSVAEDMRRFSFRPSTSPEGSSFSRMARDLYPYAVNKRLTAIEEMLARQESVQVRPIVSELVDITSRIKDLFTRMTKASDRNQFESVYLEMRTELHSFSKRLEEESQRITLTAQKEGSDTLYSSIALSAAIVVFGLITLFVSQRSLRPLPDLIDSIRKITGGDLFQSLKVNASDKDEIAVLAREYNRMLEALRERDEKIGLQQRELLQSEKLAAVGQLSAEVVHEIRNPLNSISLNIDWLEDQLKNDRAEVTKTLRSISREILRLHEITESYLVRSKVPFEEEEATDLNQLIQEIVEFGQEEYKTRKIQVETELTENAIYIRTDRSRMKQALLNIMKNAKEAMPRGGKLKIRTEIRDNVYRLHISDSGYGMNEAILQQTFRPFYTTKTNGTGLGLTLTKSIVEEAHGSIVCESRVGEGTTFTMQFPV